MDISCESVGVVGEELGAEAAEDGKTEEGGEEDGRAEDHHEGALQAERRADPGGAGPAGVGGGGGGVMMQR